MNYTQYQQDVERLYAYITEDKAQKPEITEESVRIGDEQIVINRRSTKNLQATQKLLDALHLSTPTVPVVQVRGTSGKGSLATSLHLELERQGVRVGSYVGPHVVSVLERYRIGGSVPSFAIFHQAMEEVGAEVDRLMEQGVRVPYIGILFALGLWLFREEQVEILVIEVGAGGRYDIPAQLLGDLVLQTTVSKDHFGFLGNSLEALMYHDTGALKEGSTFITSVSQEHLLSLAKKEVEHQGVKFEVASSGGAGLRDQGLGLGLQKKELSLLEAALQHIVPLLPNHTLVVSPSPKTQDLSPKTSFFPARLQLLQKNPYILVDGAHNPEKMAYLAAHIRHIQEEEHLEQVLVLCSTLESKDAGELFHPLFPLVDEFYATTVTSIKGRKFKGARALADELMHHTYPPSVHMAPTYSMGYAQAKKVLGPKDLLVVTGSLYLAGEILKVEFGEEAILQEMQA